MIIDAHSHMLQDFHPCSELPQTFDDLENIDVDGLCKGLDAFGVENTLTLSQEMTRVRNDWLGSNELSADLQQRFEGRFTGIASFEPLTPAEQFNSPRFEQVRKLLRNRRVKGLLITPPYGNFQLNDRRAYPFYQLAVECDVPIYVHLVQPPDEWGEPFNPPKHLCTLEQVVGDFPALRFNIEHMAQPRCEDLLELMAQHPNIWTDITKLLVNPQLPHYLKTALEGGFLDRVFWGTDYVGSDAATYLEWIRTGIDFVRYQLNPLLKGHNFSPLKARHIDGLLGDNIRRFLRF